MQRLDYPIRSIQLNQREILISDILAGKTTAHDEFEETTLQFIRDWLEGRNDFVLHTSGSTGAPKEILIKRSQMEKSALATVQALNLNPGDHALICLNTRFIAGQMMLVRCLTHGMHIHAATPTANPLQNFQWGNNVQFAAFVPYQLHAILHSDQSQRLNEIKNIIVGGAPLPAETEKLLGQYDCRIFLTYGMTETISHVALRRVNGEMRSSRYTALPGISFETDERSCLVITTPYISGKTVTNDVVTLYDEVTFEWVGRIDDAINSGGLKIHPEMLERKIEPLLRRLDLHVRFAVSGLPDDRLGEKVVVVLERDLIDAGRASEILSFLQASLPKLESPKALFALTQLPETASGKINRSKIRDLLSKQP